MQGFFYYFEKTRKNFSENSSKFLNKLNDFLQKSTCNIFFISTKLEPFFTKLKEFQDKLKGFSKKRNVLPIQVGVVCGKMFTKARLRLSKGLHWTRTRHLSSSKSGAREKKLNGILLVSGPAVLAVEEAVTAAAGSPRCAGVVPAVSWRVVMGVGLVE